MTTDIGADRWEELRQQWLLSKFALSQSPRTIEGYSATTAYFRSFLRSRDLDWQSQALDVAEAARAFLVRSDKGFVSPGTFNQRHATLSSFYQFLIRQGILTANPMKLIERARQPEKEPQHEITPAGYRAAIRALNTATMKGKRDLAIIALAGISGKRSSELLDLNTGDIVITGNDITINWSRMKGGVSATREYGILVCESIETWLKAYYGDGWRELPPGTPVFVNLSTNKTGNRLTHDGLRLMIKGYLGTSKVHALRRLCAALAQEAGMDIMEIQAILGHRSIETTRRYTVSARKRVNELTKRITAHVSGEE